MKIGLLKLIARFIRYHLHLKVNYTAEIRNQVGNVDHDVDGLRRSTIIISKVHPTL